MPRAGNQCEMTGAALARGQLLNITRVSATGFLKTCPQVSVHWPFLLLLLFVLAFLVLGHGRRQLLWFEVTRHPTAAWLARQITEAFPWTSAPGYLVRDNDRAYGHVFTARVRAMGIRDRPIPPGSPWQNGIAERLIGTLRRECLDQLAIFGEAHLRRILSAYSAYYNEARTHLALQKDAPLRRAVQRSGAIVAVPILAGLHHQYVRI